MPPSPSFPSGSRGKWKKRKAESLSTRRNNHATLNAINNNNNNNNNNNKPEDEDDDDDLPAPDNDELDNIDDSDDPLLHPNPQSAFTLLPNNSHETEVLSNDGVRISEFPLAVRRSVSRPHSSVLEIVALERAHQFGESKVQPRNSWVLENVSYGQLQALSAVPADSPALLDQDRAESSNSSYVVTPPSIMEGEGVVKRFGNRAHVVPMQSDWFSPAMVHRLERQVVPHFFSGKSSDHTPEKYMECRNYIVAKYMENPDTRLTVSDCHRLNVGVVNDDLTRIFKFLDNWGIINYSAREPSHDPQYGNSCLKEDLNGEIHVPSAALKSVDSLIKFDKPKCRLKVADVYSSLSCHNDDIFDLDSKIRDHLSENQCHSCSRTLPIISYQSQKDVDVLLCSDCFHEGKHVTGHSSIDFSLVDLTKDYGDLDGESWTDQETLLLLEAIEIYNENWNEIAEHVGSKSKAQCILHFLRLPIEDRLLENVEVPGASFSNNSSSGDFCGRPHSNTNGDVSGNCHRDLDFESRLPFANSGNPVMALVAFLASAVGPRVAAACAHASLAALSEDNDSSASGHSNKMTLESGHVKEGGTTRDFPSLVKQKGENDVELELTSLSEQKVKAAASAGLAAAATKAKLFADHEEREIQRLSANIINHQLKRLELKLKQFAEIETFLMKECEQVERTRQRFIGERTRMLSVQYGPSGAISPMTPPNAGPSVASSSATNIRQQIVSAPPSQPGVSGYANNQPVHHPHTSYMPRQPLFGLGPRLPLSAIQPSSAPPNAMFNGPGSSQRPVTGTTSGLG